MKTLRFSTNINTKDCLAALSPHFEHLDGVLKWKVDLLHPEKILSVLGSEIDSLYVINIVKKAGFEAVLVEQEGGI